MTAFRDLPLSASPEASPKLPSSPPLNPRMPAAPRGRPGWRFLLAHPAHWIALGFGSGLSPVAPGTVGTLLAWALHAAFGAGLGVGASAGVLVIGTLVGWWACTVTARHLGLADPGSIVWDEFIGFWIVLWLVTPAGLWAQAAAFLLFRFFDAAKPGPVAWADQLWKGRRGAPIGWPQGFGILFDDAVAALCTLLVLAVWQFVM